MSEQSVNVKRPKRGRPARKVVMSAKAGPWLRLYRELVHDPKLILLNERLFKHWVFALCIADHITGVLPPVRDLACHLRTTPKEAADTIDSLIEAGLVDADYSLPSEPRFLIHGWQNRQRVWDGQDPSNGERQRRFRERRNGRVTENSNGRNGRVTANVTENRSESVSKSVSDSDKPVSVSQGKTRHEPIDSAWIGSEESVDSYARDYDDSDDEVLP